MNPLPSGVAGAVLRLLPMLVIAVLGLVFRHDESFLARPRKLGDLQKTGALWDGGP